MRTGACGRDVWGRGRSEKKSKMTPTKGKEDADRTRKGGGAEPNYLVLTQVLSLLGAPDAMNEVSLYKQRLKAIQRQDNRGKGSTPP